jgi:hypothetical protein
MSSVADRPFQPDQMVPASRQPEQHEHSLQPLPASLERSQTDFREHYNRSSFLFEHDLGSEPIFSMASMLQLARRHPASPAYSYWSNGNVDIADGWNAGEEHRYTLAETVAGIESNDSLVMLKHIEGDGVLGPRIRELLHSILGLVGARMSEDVTVARGTLLIASPHRTTSYHIDSDVNFLLQISGDKVFTVFDRTVTAAEELERYYLGDPSGAVFKPAAQSDGKRYELRAGCGVHVPCMAAHWARALDSPSIALSLNFDLRSVANLGRLYRLNGRMRRHGIRPVAPGVSKWRDQLKMTLIDGLDGARRLAASLVGNGHRTDRLSH